ncbi:MAG: phage terminase large subunit family protein [Thaumarchaeota archaeon]|nr:phage terminase large subunit family protein [Nitrososphaerota archaeon]
MKRTRRALKKYQDVKRAALKQSLRPSSGFSCVSYDNLASWSEGIRLIKGRRFSLADRPHLRKLYNLDYREINIVKGRQTEMTEFALNWLLFDLTRNANTIGLYMSDRQDHVSIFSRLRLQGAIEQSPYLQQQVRRGEHNVRWQSFVNGSHLYMYSGWGDFEAARSIPADFVVIDEMQSQNVGAIPVVKESMAHSRFKKIIKIGTGSDEGDAWHREWNAGTILGWDKRTESWIPRPDVSGMPGVASLHIPQSMMEYVNPNIGAEIEQKKMTYTHRNFVNEVEGWFYKGMRKPLLESDIRALMDRNLDFTAAIDIDHTMPVYVGVDWGGGLQAFTVAWVWQLINRDLPRFQLLYVKKYDDRSTEVQADKIITLIDAVEADRVVVDAGGGPRQVEKLSDRYAERVFKCHYLSRPEQPFEPISDERRINVDRTWIIETMIDLITRPETRDDFPHPIPRLIIPGVPHRLDEIEWIIDHFTCIEAETSNAAGRPRTIYTHPDDTTDDAIHAACYAYLAWLLDDRTRWDWVRFG